MSTPIVPPRPSKAQSAATAAGATKLPEIPPRPIPRRLDRSISPSNYPQSPLNEPAFGSSLSRKTSLLPPEEMPARPPSVKLPSIGQEGNEYQDIPYGNPTIAGTDPESAAQSRNVGHDLPMHAPKATLSQASAKAQVKTVTRTDASQAAAFGLGMPDAPLEDSVATLRPRSSFSGRPESQGSGSRRQSLAYDQEQGPAEWGMRVPINPNLGDVQAPSPAPFGINPMNGAAFERKRHHGRTKSGREVFVHHDSYGLHGRDVPQDKFDKEWYAKHPEQYMQDALHGHGHYAGIGAGRGDFALSSEDLNQIVRETASRGSGFGEYYFSAHSAGVDISRDHFRHTWLSG